MRNTAKIRASAVSAFSPPDSSDSDCSFLPGGLAASSRPAASGSSRSVNDSRAAAAEQPDEQRFEMLLDLGERCAQALAPLPVERADCRRRRSIAPATRLLGFEILNPERQLRGLVDRAQIDRAEPFARRAEPRQLGLELGQPLGAHRLLLARAREVPEACPQGGSAWACSACARSRRASRRAPPPGLDPIRLGPVQLRLSFGQGRLGHGQRLIELATLTLDTGELRLQLGALPLERHRRSSWPTVPGELDAAPASSASRASPSTWPAASTARAPAPTCWRAARLRPARPGPGRAPWRLPRAPDGLRRLPLPLPQACARRAELILDRLSLAGRRFRRNRARRALVSQTRAPRLGLDLLQLLLVHRFGQLPLGFPPALQLGACLSQAFPGCDHARCAPS